MSQKKQTDKSVEQDITSGSLSNQLLEMVEETSKLTPRDNRSHITRVVQEMVQKGIKFEKKSLQECDAWIERIDERLSEVVSQVLHDGGFKALEGAWRGLQHLVDRSELGSELRLQILDLSRDEFIRDLTDSDFDESELYRKVYRTRFDMLGGKPLGAIVGDFYFSHESRDVLALSNMTKIAARSHCPFLAAPSPECFGLEGGGGWEPLQRLDNKNIENRFLSPDNDEMIAWRELRESSESRYLALCLPRVLARRVYGRGETETPASLFKFQEFPVDPEDGRYQKMPGNQEYCWMNAAFALAGCMAEANFQNGWPVAFCGPEAGGKVESLPLHFEKLKGNVKKLQCPTEVSLSMNQEKMLSVAGFMPLIYEQNTSNAVFISGQSVYKPKTFTRDKRGNELNASQNLSAWLPNMMAVSKAAHVMQKMLVQKLGKLKEADELEDFLQRWFVNNFVTEAKFEEAKLAKPFAKAQIKVTEDEGNPGVYGVECHLTPHTPIKEVDVGISLIAGSQSRDV